MKLRSLIYLTPFFSSFLFAMSFNFLNAQTISDDTNLDSNASSIERNSTNAVRFFVLNNLSDAAKRYEDVQRFETGPPSKIIDQEEHEDESLEELKRILKDSKVVLRLET